MQKRHDFGFQMDFWNPPQYRSLCYQFPVKICGIFRPWHLIRHFRHIAAIPSLNDIVFTSPGHFIPLAIFPVIHYNICYGNVHCFIEQKDGLFRMSNQSFTLLNTDLNRLELALLKTEYFMGIKAGCSMMWYPPSAGCILSGAETPI